jgi:hypothetical protein
MVSSSLVTSNHPGILFPFLVYNFPDHWQVGQIFCVCMTQKIVCDCCTTRHFPLQVGHSSCVAHSTLVLRENSIVLDTPLYESSKEISRLTWISSPGCGHDAWRHLPHQKN